MSIAWLIPVAIVALGAGVLALARRGDKDEVSLPQEPVSGQWLAEARSREEHHW